MRYIPAMATAGPFHELSHEKLAPATLEALQTEKLNALLAAISGSNKFYKNKFKAAGFKISETAKHTVRDLPLTTKPGCQRSGREAPPFG